MKRINLKILFLLILLWGWGTVVSNASINVSSNTVNSGEKVTISVSSSQSLGAYTISVADNGGLTFVTSTGQEGSGKTVISGSSASGVTSLATFTFQAPNVTEDRTYKVKISASGMETPNLEPVANATVTANITVKAPSSNAAEEKPSEKTDTSNGSTSGTTNNSSSSKSSNANLSNLIVSPVDFTGFKASKTSGYSVTVENDVTEVKITAKTQDSKAKVSVSGNKDLKVGKNTVKVLVTAEDGTQKTYTVNVTRKEKKEENTNITEENKVEIPTEEVNPEENETILTNAEVSNLGLISLNLVGITSNDITIEPNITPAFDTNVYSYTASVTSDIESIKVDALANRDGVTIEVMGNENLVIGENIVTILLKSENGEEQQTYQIVVTKTEENLGLTHNTKLVQYIILGIGVAIIQLAIIIAVVRIIRNRKKRLEGKVSIIEDDIHEEERIQESPYKEENNDLKKEYLDNYNQKDSPKKDSFNGKKNGKRFK